MMLEMMIAAMVDVKPIMLMTAHEPQLIYNSLKIECSHLDDCIY